MVEAPPQGDDSPGASSCHREGSRAPTVRTGSEAELLERTTDASAGRADLDFTGHWCFCGAQCGAGPSGGTRGPPRAPMAWSRSSTDRPLAPDYLPYRKKERKVEALGGKPQM